jgi:hypothetical protein
MKKGRANRIHDAWMFWLVCPALALASVHVGNDNTLSELIRMPSYFTDLALAFVSTYGVVFYLRNFHAFLNSRYGLETHTRSRVFMQLGAGVVLPVAVVISLELIYLSIIHIPLKNSSVFYLELPLVVVFCVMINLVYAMMYHKSALHTRPITSSGLGDVREAVRTDYNFTVHSGHSLINILADQVAYFIVFEKQTFLVTREGKRFLYTEPVSRIQEGLPEGIFFQLNRQVTSSRGSIRQVEYTPTRRLKIVLTPPPGVAVYVSKSRATTFSRWLNGK